MSSTSDPLPEVALRLRRASEHLDRLREEIFAYMNNRPCVPVIDDEAALYDIVRDWDRLDLAAQSATSHRALRVLATEVRPLPDALPILVGDVLHSVRAALDYIAYTLALSRASILPVDWERQTYFPIRRGAVQPSKDPRTGCPRDALLKPRTTDAIETALDALQPYNAGDARGEKLARIRDLNDIDKHRALHTVIGYTEATRVSLIFPNGKIRGGEAQGMFLATDQGWTQQRLENNASLGVCMFTEAVDILIERPGQVRVEVNLAVTVSLDETPMGDSRAEPVERLLQSFIDLIRHEIVPTFTPLL